MSLPKMKTDEEYSLLAEKILINHAGECYNCGSPTKPILNKEDIVICSWKGCKKRASKFKGTIFWRKKISEILILKILDCWLHKLNTNSISFVTGVTPKHVSKTIKKVGKIVIPNYYSSLSKIGGNDIIVEVDESKFGKRKYNKGHSVEGVWILGMVERTEKRKIVLIKVDDRSKKTLEEKLSNNIKSDSTLYSDCWKGYCQMGKIFNQHKTVNHSKEFVDSKSGAHTNSIEGTWFAVKQQVPVRNRTSKEIGLFLLRFMILRNEEGDPLEQLIKFL